MEVMIFHRPQETPAATWEDQSVRIAYNNYWVDFRDGKVFVSAEPFQQVNTADAKGACGFCPGAHLNPDMNYCPKCGRKLRR